MRNTDEIANCFINVRKSRTEKNLGIFAHRDSVLPHANSLRNNTKEAHCCSKKEVTASQGIRYKGIQENATNVRIVNNDSEVGVKTQTNLEDVERSNLEDVERSNLEDVERSNLEDVERSNLEDIERSNLEDVERSIILVPDGGSNERRRFQIYLDAWMTSSLPNPNFFLTVNLRKDELLKFCDGGNTVSSYFSKVFDIVRKHFERAKQALVHVWAAEVKNGKYHLHCLLHIPSKKLANKILLGLVKRLSNFKDKMMFRLKDLWTNNSGLSVHGAWISANRTYGATGLNGLEGVISYISKSICYTACRKKGLPLGKTVGASVTITNMTKNVRVGGRNKISYVLLE